MDDKTHKPRGIVRIYEENGTFFGRIETSFNPEELTARCRKCSGDRKDAPVIGLVIMRGLTKRGGEYSGGEILDPETGWTYRCRFTLSGEGEKLFVRGYLGMSLLGRTQTWFRTGSIAEAPLPGTKSISAASVAGKNQPEENQAMKRTVLPRLLFAIIICGIAAAPIFAQAPPPPPPPPSFGPQELEQMVASIALYPDPLLAQVLTASNFFYNEIPDADGWARAHSYLSGDALARAINEDQLPWDPSVIALLPFPTVLDQLAGNMAWTEDLGNGVLANRASVMDAFRINASAHTATVTCAATRNTG